MEGYAFPDKKCEDFGGKIPGKGGERNDEFEVEGEIAKRAWAIEITVQKRMD